MERTWERKSERELVRESCQWIATLFNQEVERDRERDYIIWIGSLRLHCIKAATLFEGERYFFECVKGGKTLRNGRYLFLFYFVLNWFCCDEGRGRRLQRQQRRVCRQDHFRRLVVQVRDTTRTKLTLLKISSVPGTGSRWGPPELWPVAIWLLVSKKAPNRRPATTQPILPCLGTLAVT